MGTRMPWTPIETHTAVETERTAMVLALQELDPIELMGPIELNTSTSSCISNSCNK